MRARDAFLPTVFAMAVLCGPQLAFADEPDYSLPPGASVVGEQPYVFGHSFVTPKAVIQHQLAMYLGVGLGYFDNMTVPLPFGASYELLLPHLAFAQARLLVDLGGGIMAMVGGDPKPAILGGEVIAGYPILSWTGTTSGRWALDSFSTTSTTSSGTTTTTSVTYVDLTLPTTTFLIGEGGLRRNALGMNGKSPEDGSYTLLLGARHRWVHHAHVLTKAAEGQWSDEADGYSNLYAHALIGHFGAKPRIGDLGEVLPGPRNIGFEVGWSSSFWLSSPSNIELSLGNSPSQGWFFLFAMSYRVWSK